MTKRFLQPKAFSSRACVEKDLFHCPKKFFSPPPHFFWALFLFWPPFFLFPSFLGGEGGGGGFFFPHLGPVSSPSGAFRPLRNS